jgi:hypothetical protein
MAHVNGGGGGESRCDARPTVPGGYKIHGYKDAHGRCCGSSLKFESLYSLVWLFCKSPWGDEKPRHVDRPALHTFPWNNCFYRTDLSPQPWKLRRIHMQKLYVAFEIFSAVTTKTTVSWGDTVWPYKCLQTFRIEELSLSSRSKLLSAGFLFYAKERGTGFLRYVK